MPSPTRRLRIAASALLATLALAPSLSIAQERGPWRATSTTARGTTGDIAFGDEKLVINFLSFPLAEIRPLKPAELAAAFNAAYPPPGTGHLFRLSIPADRRFLHKNTLCGTDETQWLATYLEGKTLQLAFFSGATPPELTPDALNTSTTLCGTFTYTR